MEPNPRKIKNPATSAGQIRPFLGAFSAPLERMYSKLDLFLPGTSNQSHLYSKQADPVRQKTIADATGPPTFMDYIRNLDCVKCLVIIFRVILLWNSEGSVETSGSPQNCPFPLDKQALSSSLPNTAVRCAFPRRPALALSMLEEFHLAQALLGLGFRLVRVRPDSSCRPPTGPCIRFSVCESWSIPPLRPIVTRSGEKSIGEQM